MESSIAVFLIRRGFAGHCKRIGLHELDMGGTFLISYEVNAVMVSVGVLFSHKLNQTVEPTVSGVARDRFVPRLGGTVLAVCGMQGPACTCNAWPRSCQLPHCSCSPYAVKRSAELHRDEQRCKANHKYRRSVRHFDQRP